MEQLTAGANDGEHEEFSVLDMTGRKKKESSLMSVGLGGRNTSLLIVAPIF
jgi:hypothetical protein